VTRKTSDSAGERKRRTSLLAFLVVPLVALLLLEVLLQILAFGVSKVYKNPAEASGEREGRVVVCVGDSFTYGYGASDLDHSYPAQLETVLEEESGEAWTVLNVGFPGRNSNQMSEALIDTLAEGPADYVVLVGGVNDPWSGATKLDLGTLTAQLESVRTPDENRGKERESGFRFELRTIKAFKTLRQGNAFGAKDATSTGEKSVDQEASPEPVSEAETENQNLSAPKIDPTSQEFVASQQAKAHQLFLAEDYEAAVAIYEALPDADSGYTAAALISCYGRLSEFEKRDAKLDSIRESYLAEPNQFRAEILLDAIMGTERNKELQDRGPEFAKLYPESFAIAFRNAMGIQTSGDILASRAEFDRARELMGDNLTNMPLGAWFWQNRAGIYSPRDSHPDLPSDPDIVAFSVICSHLSGQRRDYTVQSIMSVAPFVDAGIFQRALERSPADDRERDELMRIYSEATSNDLERKGAAVTRHNFATLSRLAKQEGADVLISTYPFIEDLLSGAQKAASADVPTYFVRINDDIQKEVAAQGKAALFVPDGHCNDQGYRLMAELIGARLLEIDQKTSSNAME